MAAPMATAPVRAWVHGFWTFYRRYTTTAAHTAATAALAIFGLLVFVDPWFAAVAIACYAVPPLVLYVRADESTRGTEPGRDLEESASNQRDRAVDPARTRSGTDRSSEGVSSRSKSDTDVGNGDTDSDSDDGDTDTDFDTAGTDTDSDSDDGDTDSDVDG